jgi:pimeloyl-ACP methyl ester carboxylesterase
MFKFTMQNPQSVAWLINGLRRLKLVNMSIAKFVDTYMGDKKVRDDLYRIWTTMRKFQPQLKRVKQNIITRQIPVHMIFGEFDRVILAENGYKFQKNAEALVSVEVLKIGHQLLREKQAEIIAKNLTN